MIITDRMPADTPVAAAIGAFDGIHRGHRALLDGLRERAGELGCPAVAVTFREHPLTLLDPERVPSLLTTRDERAAILRELGMDILVELPFTRELADTEPEDFIRSLSPCGLLRHVTVGFNFRFGAHGRGDGALIGELGDSMHFTTSILPPFRVGGKTVSSTAIRECIVRGKMEEAAALLGRGYGYRGNSVRGKQLGRTIGFPTVNLLEEPEKTAPPSGVYASVLVHRGVRYPAMTNVGRNPTVESVIRRRIETHALSAAPDVQYGDEIAVELLRHTRGEVAFPDVAALRGQLARDMEEIAAFHRQIQVKSCLQTPHGVL